MRHRGRQRHQPPPELPEHLQAEAEHRRYEVATLHRRRQRLAREHRRSRKRVDWGASGTSPQPGVVWLASSNAPLSVDADVDDVQHPHETPNPRGRRRRGRKSPARDSHHRDDDPDPHATGLDLERTFDGADDVADILLAQPVVSVPCYDGGAPFDRNTILPRGRHRDTHTQGMFPGASVALPSYVQGAQLDQDEDGHHEFKGVQLARQPVNNIARIAPKYINAFLNSDGGTIFFGVDDSGIVHGIPFTRRQRDETRLRIDEAVSRLQPQVDPNLIDVRFVHVVYPPDDALDDADTTPQLPSNRYVFQVSVQRGRAPVYVDVKGVAYLRRSGSVYRMDDATIRARQELGRPLPLPRLSSSAGPLRRDLRTVPTGATPSRKPNKTTTVATATTTPPAITVSTAPMPKRDDATAAISTSPRSPGEPVTLIARARLAGTPSGAIADFVGRDAEMGVIEAFVRRSNHIPHHVPLSSSPSSSSSLSSLSPQHPLDEVATTMSRHVNGVTLILLHGLPMAGKSTLARRLLVHFRLHYGDFSAIIDLKSPNRSYIHHVEAQVSVVRSAYPTLPPDALENATSVSGLYESCFRAKCGSLLIENAGKIDHVERLIPHTGMATLVVVTSRKDLSVDQLAAYATLSVAIGALSPENAVLLLRSTLPPSVQVSDSEATALCRLCGNLPLPIRLVASQLARKRNLTAKMMINLFSKDDDKRLALVKSSFATNWSLYPNRVKRHVIPLALFPSTFDCKAAAALWRESYLASVDHLGTLLSYSLVSWDSVAERYWQNDLLKLFCAREGETSDVVAFTRAKVRFVYHFANLLGRQGQQEEEGDLVGPDDSRDSDGDGGSDDETGRGEGGDDYCASSTPRRASSSFVSYSRMMCSDSGSDSACEAKSDDYSISDDAAEYTSSDGDQGTTDTVDSSMDTPYVSDVDESAPVPVADSMLLVRAHDEADTSSMAHASSTSSSPSSASTTWAQRHHHARLVSVFLRERTNVEAALQYCLQLGEQHAQLVCSFAASLLHFVQYIDNVESRKHWRRIIDAVLTQCHVSPSPSSLRVHIHGDGDNNVDGDLRVRDGNDVDNVHDNDDDDDDDDDDDESE